MQEEVTTAPLPPWSPHLEHPLSDTPVAYQPSLPTGAHLNRVDAVYRDDAERESFEIPSRRSFKTSLSARVQRLKGRFASKASSFKASGTVTATSAAGASNGAAATSVVPTQTATTQETAAQP
jgi:hypothetical protein